MTQEKLFKKLVEGSADQIRIQLYLNHGPYDISAATEIVVKIPTISGTPIAKSLSGLSLSRVGTGEAGQILVPVAVEDIALMIKSDPRNPEKQNMEATLTFPSGVSPVVVELLDSLVVVSSGVPTPA